MNEPLLYSTHINSIFNIDSKVPVLRFKMNATKTELLDCILRNKTALALIDTRSPQQMRIPSKIENAVNISNIPEAMKLSMVDFKTKFGVEYPENGSIICLHCNTGRGSGHALAELVENHAELAERFEWRTE